MEKNIINIKSSICIVLMLILLTGCTPALFQKTPEYIEYVNELEIQDASYFARYLMDRDERYKLEATVRNYELKHQSNQTTVTAGGAVGASLLGSNPMSASGAGTAAEISGAILVAGALINMFEPDGNIEMVSKIYVPSKLNGASFDTVEEATLFAREYTRKKILEFANKENRSLECVFRCGESSSVYKLVKNGFKGDELYDPMSKATDGQFYDPPSLFIVTAQAKMQAATNDEVRNRILGFTPKWESMYQNGWHTYVVGEVDRNKLGDVESIESKRLGLIAKSWKFNTERSPLARRFYRTLTGNEFLIYRGTDNNIGRQVAVKGKVYKFLIRSSNRFLDFEISPETDIN